MRLSIFKRLKISIFRHQPRKRWGEATRRDMKSKQALGRAGRCGSHSSEDAHGDRDIMGHHEPWTWPQGDAGSHKRAAGLSTSGDALPQGRMLSTKVGCSVSQMLSTIKAGCC